MSITQDVVKALAKLSASKSTITNEDLIAEQRRLAPGINRAVVSHFTVAMRRCGLMQKIRHQPMIFSVDREELTKALPQIGAVFNLCERRDKPLAYGPLKKLLKDLGCDLRKLLAQAAGERKARGKRKAANEQQESLPSLKQRMERELEARLTAMSPAELAEAIALL